MIYNYFVQKTIPFSAQGCWFGRKLSPLSLKNHCWHCWAIIVLIVDINCLRCRQKHLALLFPFGAQGCWFGRKLSPLSLKITKFPELLLLFLAVIQTNTSFLYQKSNETRHKGTTFFWFNQIFLTKSYKKNKKPLHFVRTLYIYTCVSWAFFICSKPN